jgi:DNA polymerase-3 subunit gamma/tau
MYTALYRNFRPETFSQLVGQGPVVKILQNQIKSGKISHAYLFCGTRGTGKTSTARILAKGVNCLSDSSDKPCGICANCISIKNGTFMDVIEIDAASNNGVENIRELRESVKYPPQIGKCKVYIIDEVHMLSTGAFNALLKTLEEPPEKVIFILATTEQQKLPATILSRCLRLDFKRISEKEMIKSMKAICQELGVEASDPALALIASNSDGSVRDCLSILDQCIAHGNSIVNRDDVVEILGTAGEAVFIELTDYVFNRETGNALGLIDRVLAGGKDTKQFIKDWIMHFRNLMMTKFINDLEDVINLSCENIERINKQGQDITVEFIHSSILLLSNTLNEAKWSSQPRTLLELAIIKISEPEMNTSIESLLARISKLENNVNNYKEQKPRMISSEEDEISGQSSFEMPKPKIKDEADKEIEKQFASDSEIKNEDKDKDKDKEDLPKLSKGQLETEWCKILDVCEKEKGSLSILRNSTRLIEMDSNTLYVEAKTTSAEEVIIRNMEVLIKIIEKHKGSIFKIKHSSKSESMINPNKISTEEIAANAASRLGIEVEISD